jgi:translation initiation factor IF-2
MTIKVYELAKELEVTSKELQEKCAALGIDVSSHMSTLGEKEAAQLRNILKKSKAVAETKIVKAAPKKKETKDEDDAPRVTVKAAVSIPVPPTKSSATRGKMEEKPRTQKPPMGKPLISKEVEGRPRPPMGKPVANRELDAREEQKALAKERAAKEAKIKEKAAAESVLRPVEEKPVKKVGSIMEATPKTAAEVKPVESRTVPTPPRPAPKPKKAEEGKPPRDNREYRKPADGKAKPSGTPVSTPAAKGAVKKDDRPKSKEKDKFAKLESGGPKKPKKTGYAGVRSLEKAPKPKKHVRQSKEIEPEIDVLELPEGTVVINVPITVAGFCEQVEIPTSKAIMEMMRLGIMATVNQNIDEDTLLILADVLGIQVKVGSVQEETVEEGIEVFKDQEEDLKARPPIITVMGHVDHGKTSLLDSIRKTHVTESESGGITQHIGASEVVINGQKIVFLDTPGHEAFTAMRARGAHITDIAVLVVAADDSVMPQTLESISHAKAAGVHIIVAINKMDKPGANLEKVKKDLADKGVLVEEWGGETISVPVSAKTGEGISTLLEMILLQAEVLELKANPNRLASGTVIEARLDKSKGPVATLLVLNGTLQSGQSVVAGTSSGKIRLMTNYKGDAIRKAGPATAVEILGLTEVPEAGDEFNVVKDLGKAKEIASNRKTKLREEVLARNASSSLEKLFSQLKEGEVKELNMIVKGDVQGSVDAIKTSLEKLKNENIRTNIIHSSVGTITESDIMLAGTVGAVIVGFNVRPSTAISQLADREKIEIRTYRVIYDLIEDVEAAMKGMLDPVFKEAVLGKAEVRETFKVPGVGIIAGSYILEGKVVRNEQIRLVRDGIIIHEGKISSLKRMKDDAKEVRDGFECGIGIENYNDIKIGDVIECFKMEQIERS